MGISALAATITAAITVGSFFRASRKKKEPQDRPPYGTPE